MVAVITVCTSPAALFNVCVEITVTVGGKKHRYTPGLPARSRRSERRYLGRQDYLQVPCEDGEGKIKLDDKFYTVRGPDLPKGTIVEIVGVDKTAFTVAKAFANLE